MRFGNQKICVQDLSPEILSDTASLLPDIKKQNQQLVSAFNAPLTVQSLAEVVQAAEQMVITAALKDNLNNLSKTARALQIDRNTLKRKMTAMGLR